LTTHSRPTIKRIAVHLEYPRQLLQLEWNSADEFAAQNGFHDGKPK
jgi:hypothetical protein